ncbi:hypothetical protein [Clostridium botulinum]|uniref:hypothetical protein n=1 Tax=Clostridium botulinum TaxID=1491 RepID=UPI001FA8EED6|nr:hypothetical protein [Clostridium botulinum]
MDRETIARDVNCKDNLTRIIVVDNKLDLKEGQIYNNMGNIDSWMGSHSTENFMPELDNEYMYVFQCSNVPCHEVDYENEEECEILDCEGCESEGECLVLPNVKMKIINIGSDEDLRELGYIPVSLELVDK